MENNKFLTKLKNENNLTTTENGAAALKSTFNACLDAFGSLGAMRQSSAEDIISTFDRAFIENQELAMRMLFYIRDIRGGQGERNTFRILTKHIAFEHPELITNNFKNFLEFGRGDDLAKLIEAPIAEDVAAFIKKQLAADMKAMRNNEPVSLLAKWLPSENTSSLNTKLLAKKLRELMKMTPRTYRKKLVELRTYIDIVETKMSKRQWSDIEYDKLPSKAAMRYSNAFFLHDEAGYTDYIKDLADGKAKINAKTLYPADIIEQVHTLVETEYTESMKVDKKLTAKFKKNRILYDALWKALPDYFTEHPDESALCMVDTSGSMFREPYNVALSLGIYCADKCKGPFHNHFLTFAEKPELVELIGNDIFDKVKNTKSINAGNTDIESAFELILNTALKNDLKSEDLPNKLYIISDMQFDEARGKDNIWSNTPAKSLTFMQEMRKRFEDAGYTMPSIVYWNVRESRCGMFQETVDGENIAMVSGYSPMLFEAVIKGTVIETVKTEDGKTVKREKIDPVEVMTKTLMSERYDCVYTGVSA